MVHLVRMDLCKVILNYWIYHILAVACTKQHLPLTKGIVLSALKPYGIKTAESYFVNLGDAIDEDAIIEKVGLPCFVKANKAGSSFGISKVYKKEDLQQALDSCL